jgi:site-specific recombinase XerD
MPKLTVVKAPTPPAIESLAAEFVTDCRARGLSIRTCQWYADTLRREFLAWAAREKVTDPSQLTPALVGSYTAHLLDEGGERGALSRATVRGYVRAVRVFLAWAEAEGGATVGASPKLPKAERVLVDVLSREEIARMENTAKTERDRLLVRVLADCGLRLGELLGMRADDLRDDHGKPTIKVTGKGSRDRLVPLAPALHRRLRRYLAGRDATGRDPVWMALRKGPDGHYGPLTKNGAEQAVRNLAREAGITRRIYPHLFRHSFATEWLRRGGNVISLQHVLGHADLGMISQVYSHLSVGDDYDAAMAVLTQA